VQGLVGLRATGARSPAITLFPEARKFGQRLAAETGPPVTTAIVSEA